MKKSLVLIMIMFMAVSFIHAQCRSCGSCSAEPVEKTPVINMYDDLLEKAPFSEKSFGRKKLVDKDYLLMMQVALLPGQKVPQHNANSNVHIVVLKGKLLINLAGRDFIVDEFDFIPVAKETPMNIRNESAKKAVFFFF